MMSTCFLAIEWSSQCIFVSKVFERLILRIIYLRFFVGFYFVHLFLSKFVASITQMVVIKLTFYQVFRTFCPITEYFLMQSRKEDVTFSFGFREVILLK